MEKIAISHYNGKRQEDQLVIYNQGESSETNKYGYEVVVEENRIVLCGGNNNKIPKNGFVVSGHGKSAIFLSEQACIGAKIDIVDGYLIIERDQETEISFATERISTIQNRINILEQSNMEYDKDKSAILLKKSKEALENKDFDLVEILTEEAYYITAESKKEETRGAWHRPLEKNEIQVEETVKRFAQAGFNLLLIETNYQGYANAMKCVSPYLPKRESNKDDFDVIEAFIKIGKKYGVKIHAWFENFFFGIEGEGCAIAKLKPHWMARRKDGGMLLDGYDCFYFLNPAIDEVRDFLRDLCKELLDKYDFDGLQLDYIRYPHIRGIEYAAGFDQASKEMFLNDSGIDLDNIVSTDCVEWNKYVLWCAERVTLYVKSIYELINEYREKGRKICLSTAVIGDPKDALKEKCQNWSYWVSQGWIDEIYPMAYYNDPIEVEKEIRMMVTNYQNLPNISGIAPMYNKLPIIETTKQVEACRKGGARGVCFFSAGCCSDEELEKLKIGVFRDR